MADTEVISIENLTEQTNADSSAEDCSSHETRKDESQNPERFELPEFWKKLLILWLPLSLICVCEELFLHLLVFREINRWIIYPVLFGLTTASLFAFVCAWLPPLGQRILGTVFVVFYTLWAVIQYMYCAIFGSFLPLAMIGLGGGALTSFFSQLLYSIGRNIPHLLLLFLPLVGWIVLLCRKKFLRSRLGWKVSLTLLGAASCFAFLCGFLMYLYREKPVSVYKLFTSSTTTTTASYRAVGMAGTTLQELRFMLFPSNQPSSLLMDPDNIQQKYYDPAKYHVLDVDYLALADSTEDETLKMLDRFVAVSVPSKMNEFTGYFKDYNVIYICAESYSPWLVTKELTPTLYEMSNNGFLFRNYYGTFNAVTTNGEFTTCLGLFPDLSREKTASSFDASVGHALPFCLGTALKPLGYDTWAYHNYIGEFYNRNATHSNMGYDFKSSSSGLKINTSWPSSDLELMQTSAQDYLGLDHPFHAYYMTFSGHYQYNWQNAMSAKNRDRVRDLPYSETVKAYIACNLELEDGLSYLMDELSKTGQLDKTLFVLTNDHYPYGLTPEEYSELAGKEIDTSFEKFHNSFICYNSAMETPVIVDDYCCTADILPTVLNLLGVEYDSRLLAGTDVLSDNPHVAILETYSFLTEDFRYNAETGVITPHRSDVTVSDETLAEWIKVVNQKFDFSREIINTDYYRHAVPAAGALVPQVSDPEKERVLEFEDVDIFAQAYSGWVIRRKLMDPDSDTFFGSLREATVGEFIDSFYRILGRPAVTTNALPENYLSAPPDPDADSGDPDAEAPPEDPKDPDDVDPEDPGTRERVPFDETYPYYDAVCWAFEIGLLRAEDPHNRWDDWMSYVDVSRIIYRFCLFYGAEIKVEPLLDFDLNAVQAAAKEAGEEREWKEYPPVTERNWFSQLRDYYPDLTEEEMTACVWCFEKKIVYRFASLIKQLDSDEVVTRQQQVAYLFRVGTYVLGID